eukprot:GEMP01002741.1.p1 GENE.GEMP01002741.1~~GEMP01002741.1.p1  ORF type:complete len:1435 (+),score=308.34 GEMP01002741.1:82-4386(+)
MVQRAMLVMAVWSTAASAAYIPSVATEHDITSFLALWRTITTCDPSGASFMDAIYSHNVRSYYKDTNSTPPHLHSKHHVWRLFQTAFGNSSAPSPLDRKGEPLAEMQRALANVGVRHIKRQKYGASPQAMQQFIMRMRQSFISAGAELIKSCRGRRVTRREKRMLQAGYGVVEQGIGWTPQCTTATISSAAHEKLESVPHRVIGRIRVATTNDCLQYNNSAITHSACFDAEENAVPGTLFAFVPGETDVRILSDLEQCLSVNSNMRLIPSNCTSVTQQQKFVVSPGSNAVIRWVGSPTKCVARADTKFKLQACLVNPTPDFLFTVTTSRTLEQLDACSNRPKTKTACDTESGCVWNPKRTLQSPQCYSDPRKGCSADTKADCTAKGCYWDATATAAARKCFEYPDKRSPIDDTIVFFSLVSDPYKCLTLTAKTSRGDFDGVAIEDCKFSPNDRFASLFVARYATPSEAPDFAGVKATRLRALLKQHQYFKPDAETGTDFVVRDISDGDKIPDWKVLEDGGGRVTLQVNWGLGSAESKWMHVSGTGEVSLVDSKNDATHFSLGRHPASREWCTTGDIADISNTNYHASAATNRMATAVTASHTYLKNLIANNTNGTRCIFLTQMDRAFRTYSPFANTNNFSHVRIEQQLFHVVQHSLTALDSSDARANPRAAMVHLRDVLLTSFQWMPNAGFDGDVVAKWQRARAFVPHVITTLNELGTKFVDKLMSDEGNTPGGHTVNAHEARFYRSTTVGDCSVNWRRGGENLVKVVVKCEKGSNTEWWGVGFRTAEECASRACMTDAHITVFDGTTVLGPFRSTSLGHAVENSTSPSLLHDFRGELTDSHCSMTFSISLDDLADNAGDPEIIIAGSTRPWALDGGHSKRWMATLTKARYDEDDHQWVDVLRCDGDLVEEIPIEDLHEAGTYGTNVRLCQLDPYGNMLATECISGVQSSYGSLSNVALRNWRHGKRSMEIEKPGVACDAACLQRRWTTDGTVTFTETSALRDAFTPTSFMCDKSDKDYLVHCPSNNTQPKLLSISARKGHCYWKKKGAMRGLVVQVQVPTYDCATRATDGTYCESYTKWQCICTACKPKYTYTHEVRHGQCVRISWPSEQVALVGAYITNLLDVNAFCDKGNTTTANSTHTKNCMDAVARSVVYGSYSVLPDPSDSQTFEEFKELDISQNTCDEAGNGSWCRTCPDGSRCNETLGLCEMSVIVIDDVDYCNGTCGAHGKCTEIRMVPKVNETKVGHNTTARTNGTTTENATTTTGSTTEEGKANDTRRGLSSDVVPSTGTKIYKCLCDDDYSGVRCDITYESVIGNLLSKLPSISDAKIMDLLACLAISAILCCLCSACTCCCFRMREKRECENAVAQAKMNEQESMQLVKELKRKLEGSSRYQSVSENDAHGGEDGRSIGGSKASRKKKTRSGAKSREILLE